MSLIFINFIVSEQVKSMIMSYPIFADFPDCRVTGHCFYSITDLFTIALLTYLCGGEDYVDMSEFAHLRARSFGLLSDTDRSPSPDELDRCLTERGRLFLLSLDEKQVAIDGKKLSGANPRVNGKNGDYILNAYVTENHLLLGQEPLSDKENEIRAIPHLLDRLDIEGATVSIDAAGTQVEIVSDILRKKAHYFLAVNDNHPALHDAVRYAFAYGRASDSSSEMEGGHGRVEERSCRIVGADMIEDEDVRVRWHWLRTIVEVTSTVTAGDETVTRTIRRRPTTRCLHASIGHRGPAPLASQRNFPRGRVPRPEVLCRTEPVHGQEVGAADCQGSWRQEKR